MSSPGGSRAGRTVLHVEQPRVVRFAELAALIMGRPARLGRTRLVAVDGFAGSGKSTFAERLARELGAPVLHTDDLLEGWTDMVSFWPRLEAWVLDPLRQGRPGRYRRYDWLHQRFAERWHDIEGPTRRRVASYGLAVWQRRSRTRPDRCPVAAVTG